MAGTEYPKIDTLYDRDERHRVIVGKLRRPEFGIIKRWSITEKIHGRNTRVTLFDTGEVEYGGKTDTAEIPPELLEYLKRIFPPDVLKAALWLPNKTLPKVATIYGEGYGPRMVPGSGIYRKDVSFRLFDSLIEGVDGSWWLERANLENVAEKLGVRCVPLLSVIYDLPESLSDLENIIKISRVATEENNNFSAVAEGIVARTDPLLFNRKGELLMWKLKTKDFKKDV